MSARTEKIVSSAKSNGVQKIVNFSAEDLKAPFLLRCGALIVDYILIVACPVIGILFSHFSGNDGAKLLNSELSNTGWLIGLLIGLTNFIILPLFISQTIGKMLIGLRIVTDDGQPPSLGKIVFRHLIGYPLTILSGGLGFLLSVFNIKGKALHDFLAGTVVIYGRRRVLD